MRSSYLVLCVVAAATALQRPAAPRVAASQRLNASPPRVGAVAETAIDRRASLSAFAACALGFSAPALALDPTKDRPNDSLLLVLRVKEAANQEIRLVKSGKYKDLQRANIKLAVGLMLTNYNLLDNINKASLLARGRSQEAYSVGVGAVEALQQVLDYFDSDAKSLKVDTISPEKLAFVVKAMEAASLRIDTYLTYLPSDQVELAKAFIDYENELNSKEYAEYEGKAYLNPKPT